MGVSIRRIDILMAVYNGENYIAEQIRSIMDQTYKNIHLWIRDNCSDDHTVKIIEEMVAKYPGSISLITSSENVGIIGNFGALMEHAQEDYIMFSDSDDVWLEGKVEQTIKKMEELEKKFGSHTPLLVHSNLKVVNETLELIHPSFWHYSRLNPFLSHTLSRQLIQNQITGCTTMINRALLMLATPLPRNIAMHDWWLGLCSAAFGKSGVVEQATMLYRQHGKNDTGAKKFGTRSYLKYKFNQSVEKRKSLRNKPYEQAETFLKQYQDKLTLNQIIIVERFIDFKNASMFKKLYMSFKYGFYRVGLIRNMIVIMGIGEIVDFMSSVATKLKHLRVKI